MNSNLLVGESVVFSLKSLRCLLLSVEVMKVLRAKKHAKTKQQQQQQELAGRSQLTVPEKKRSGYEAEGKSDMEKTSQVSYLSASH